jgi:hypothetical protein
MIDYGPIDWESKAFESLSISFMILENEYSKGIAFSWLSECCYEYYSGCTDSTDSGCFIVNYFKASTYHYVLPLTDLTFLTLSC